MSSRWDELYAARPVPLVDFLLDEVAKLLAKDLERWPPPIQEIDPATFGAFEALFTEGAPPPHEGIYPAAFHLARLSLGREHDAYDDYVRNGRYREAGVPESDRPALLFLTRWLEEQVLSLMDATEGRIKRPQLVECLRRTEKAWAAARRATGRA